MPRAWSLALASAILLGYLALCPPVSGDKDSAEFTLVLALLGVAHPTGYPLFTILGHAWVTAVHALGATWAYAANTWTAFGGAVATYFLHRLGVALLAPQATLSRGARAGFALLPVLFFAFNPIWTYETTLAEVNAWHVAWALGAALHFTWTVRAAERDAPLLSRAAAWGLLSGIGAAHHATSVFVVIPLSIALVILLARRGRFTFVLAAVALLVSLVPVASYGFVLWRGAHPSPVQWPWLETGLRGLLRHASGGQYAGRLGGFDPSAEQRRFLASYVWPFLFPGLALLAFLARRAAAGTERWIAWTLAISAALGTAYAFVYEVPDPSSYFLHPMAYGLVALAPLLGAWSLRSGAARGVAWAAALLALILSGMWFEIGLERARLFVQFDGYVKRMWQSIPFDRAVVFWTNDMYYKLPERQLLDHEKPGIVVLNAGVLEADPVRRAFEKRWGFDPVPPRWGEGDAAAQMEERMNVLQPLPVIHFDPAVGTVRLLKKPGAPADSAR